MSTCSAFIVDSGALFTHNSYRRYLVHEATDRHYLAIGRWSGVIVTILGVVFALYEDVVLEAFPFTETIAAFMGRGEFRDRDGGRLCHGSGPITASASTSTDSWPWE